MQGWAACTVLRSDTCYYSVGCCAHVYLLRKYNYAARRSKQIRRLNVQVESLIACYLQYLQSSVLAALPTCRDLQQLNIEDCSVPRSVAYSQAACRITRIPGLWVTSPITTASP